MRQRETVHLQKERESVCVCRSNTIRNERERANERTNERVASKPGAKRRHSTVGVVQKLRTDTVNGNRIAESAPNITQFVVHFDFSIKSSIFRRIMSEIAFLTN